MYCIYRRLLHLALLLAVTSGLHANPKEYVIAPQDLVVLQVYRQPDLNLEQRVDANGHINLPLIGNVSIAGRTTREAEVLIANAFVEGEYLLNPQVSLNIAEYAPRGVSIIGEVKQPGFVQFNIERGAMDLREVVAQAGGFTSVARRGNIQVIRRSANGSEKVFEVNFDDLMRNRGTQTGFLVMHGDVIMVPARIF